MQRRDFRRIRPLISKTAAITLANLVIHSRLDIAIAYFMISIITIHRLQKVKKQQLALSIVVSVHHISFRFLNICIGYLLTTVSSHCTSIFKL